MIALENERGSIVIVDVVRDDIWESPCRSIAFPVNADGYNDSGFAGVVSRMWPGLAATGPKTLGTVTSRLVSAKVIAQSLGRTDAKGISDKTLYAMVCHTLGTRGWAETPDIVQGCLDHIKNVSVADLTNPIAVVLPGAGMVGQVMGADLLKIMAGIARSHATVAIYTTATLTAR